MKLSLIIPCYNEASNLPLLLEKCSLVTRTGEIEVILVDNGSTDATAAVLNHLLPSYPGCRSVRVAVNKGYGNGILAGLEIAQGDILGWTHADLQTNPQDALQGLAKFNDSVDEIFVKGARYGRPMTDALFTFGMSIFETVLLRKRFWDINAQPTMFSRRFYKSWVNAPKDFSLDLYAYYMAKEANLRIVRFPVKFGVRAHGISHWNISWSDKLRFIKRTALYSWRLHKEYRGRGIC